MREYRLSSKYEKLMEENFVNTDEAFALLDLIVCEWNSDPMSVQCFDLRLVERAKECIRKRRNYEKDRPFP